MNPNQSIESKDAVLYQTSLHESVLFPPLIVEGLIILWGSLLSFTRYIPISLAEIWFLAAIFLAIDAAYGLALYFNYKNSIVAVTATKLISQGGRFRSQSAVLDLAQINIVGCRRPILGRIMGYSTVLITDKQGAVLRLDMVRHPCQILQEVNSQKRKIFERTSKTSLNYGQET
jgi:hypothetical protein